MKSQKVSSMANANDEDVHTVSHSSVFIEWKHFLCFDCFTASDIQLVAIQTDWRCPPENVQMNWCRTNLGYHFPNGQWVINLKIDFDDVPTQRILLFIRWQIEMKPKSIAQNCVNDLRWIRFSDVGTCNIFHLGSSGLASAGAQWIMIWVCVCVPVRTVN